MSIKSDVFVIKDGVNYLVRPAFIVVRRQRSFRLRNFSGQDIRISLPKAFEAEKREVRVDSGKQETVKVPGFLPPGVYRYTVEVSGVPRRKRFAQGNSAPIIIIDR